MANNKPASTWNKISEVRVDYAIRVLHADSEGSWMKAQLFNVTEKSQGEDKVTAVLKPFEDCFIRPDFDCTLPDLQDNKYYLITVKEAKLTKKGDDTVYTNRRLISTPLVLTEWTIIYPPLSGKIE